MLTPTEANLSQANYDAIKDKTEGSIFKVIAHRYNLNFSQYADMGTAANTEQGFSSLVTSGGYLLRALVDGSGNIDVDRYLLSDGSHTTSTFNGVHASTDIAPSLVESGGTITIFYLDTAGGIIRSRTSADNGATWSAAGTVYDPGALPTLYTPDQCIGGTPIFSTEKTPTPNNTTEYLGAYAFDNGLRTYWGPSSGTTGTIGYQFTAGKVIIAYTITPSPGPSFTGSPKNWTFEGSNNGSAWTTLHTVTNNTFASDTPKLFTFANSTSYTYYRLNITAVTSGVFLLLAEIQMYEADPYPFTPQITAPASDGVYFFRFITGGGYQLYKSTYSGSWSSAAINMVTPYRPLSMDAVRVNGVDYVFVAVNLPGQKVERLEGTVLKSDILDAWCLICFTVSGSDISAPVFIEEKMEVTSTDYIQNVKVQYVNDKFFVTVYTSYGAPEKPLTAYRYYTSKDTINWSAPNIIYLGANQGSSGYRLHQSGDYVYAVEQRYIWRSYSTLLTGYSPSAIQEDITDRLRDYSMSHDGIFQANMVLDSEDGWLEAHTWFNRDNVIALQHQVGYYDGTTPRLYDQAYTEIDSFERSQDLPENLWRISARDRLAWMTDKNAEYFRDFRCNLPAIDDYADDTTTNYGALSHFATQYGEWVGSSGIALAYRGTSLALGFSTLHTDVWNGAVEVQFNRLAAGEAGIIFRAYDKNNYMAAVYKSSDDKIHLYEIRDKALWGDVYKDTASASTLSWTGTGVSRWIRVVFFWSMVKIYSSDDGITWTERISATLQHPNARSGRRARHVLDEDVPLFGYVGLICRAENEFSNFKVHTFDHIRTIEDVFKILGSQADIHDYAMLGQYTPSTSDWTTSAASVGVSGDDITVTGSATTGNWGTAIQTGVSLLSSHTLEFDITGANWGVIAKRKSSAATDWRLYVNADRTLTLKDQAGTTLFSDGVAYAPASGSYHVKATYHENYYAPNKVNAFLSVWFDNRLVLSYVIMTAPTSESFLFGLMAFESNAVTFNNFNIPSLGEVAEIASIDPNEAPISALQRSIDGKHLKYFVRYNGAIRAWRPKTNNSVKTLTDFDTIDTSYAPHEIKTAIRMVGAYTTAEYYDPALFPKYGYRFVEVNNPYLFSVWECYNAAMHTLRGIRGNALNATYNLPFMPFVEIEDHITVGTDERIITSTDIEVQPGFLQQTIKTREYISG